MNPTLFHVSIYMVSNRNSSTTLPWILISLLVQ
uniref:Uncharacterized protein n=1 Tax=Anguilla anguilla TaxID=7936 RepID=A0A0E9SSJ6_ANGAN